MEIYSNTTRFSLACNASSKIIEPIQSRCAIVRYMRLSDKDILSRLVTVCQAEKVPVPSHIAYCLATFPIDPLGEAQVFLVKFLPNLINCFISKKYVGLL